MKKQKGESHKENYMLLLNHNLAVKSIRKSKKEKDYKQTNRKKERMLLCFNCVVDKKN